MPKNLLYFKGYLTDFEVLYSVVQLGGLVQGSPVQSHLGEGSFLLSCIIC